MPDWRKNLRDVVPYVPGEQPKSDNVIKLNTNENPYPPAAGVRECMRNMDISALRLYPDPEAGILTDAIAQYYSVDKDMVFVGVGSDDVLAMSFLTFFNSEKPVLFPDITYSFYDVWAELYDIPYERPVLREDFTIDADDYIRECGGIVIANPNAPTSLCMPVCDIERIVAANPGVVVIIDEAYVDFGGESALVLTDKYDNILVVRTFSKSRSLAGLRIGFAIGNPELIRALNSVKLSYNSYTMNLPSIVMGAEALKDDEYFRKTIDRIIATRESAVARLCDLGFCVPDSKANFVFARHESVPAAYIFDNLRKENIYVRYFPKPRIDNYLRITIGTDNEMDVLFEALGRVVNSYKKNKKSVDI